MGSVSAFWMGAAAAGAGGELLAAIKALGGWEALSGRRSEVTDQVLQGLSPARRRRFVEATEVVTPYAAITLDQAAYPPRLADIDDPPPVLFVEGEVEVLRRSPSIAVVGTRRATRRAIGATSELVHHLAPRGTVIVSGLARGIDRAAHEAALASGVPTVAVLGHGLAFTSPRSNRHLRRRIVDAGGAIVSTWPDGVEATRYTFPLRNRWIAALTTATCVMQAGERSGALITARHATELGRGVVAYAPAGSDAAFAGCRTLGGEGGHCYRQSREMAQVVLGEQLPPLAPWLRRLFAGDPLVVVATTWGGEVQALSRELVRLELEGVVVRHRDGRYAPGKELPCHPS